MHLTNVQRRHAPHRTSQRACVRAITADAPARPCTSPPVAMRMLPQHQPCSHVAVMYRPYAALYSSSSSPSDFAPP
eukprot:CAMPEP_0181329376 /NCGR_PEP_ID=MMETSP1101-20121128/23273_1 /TAXON_ID=46948 /ORGANISM="Rhodomonas abbreviata, Strain Caron Lab Isolate" /LENGTH=75 /DNA_ID=CAMNT_0023438441 /DNA_START=141 /DNA_END=366 /DNA_ORIENTATION=+